MFFPLFAVDRSLRDKIIVFPKRDLEATHFPLVLLGNYFVILFFQFQAVSIPHCPLHSRWVEDRDVGRSWGIRGR